MAVRGLDEVFRDENSLLGLVAPPAQARDAPARNRSRGSSTRPLPLRPTPQTGGPSSGPPAPACACEAQVSLIAPSLSQSSNSAVSGARRSRSHFAATQEHGSVRSAPSRRSDSFEAAAGTSGPPRSLIELLGSHSRGLVRNERARFVGCRDVRGGVLVAAWKVSWLITTADPRS